MNLWPVEHFFTHFLNGIRIEIGKKYWDLEACRKILEKDYTRHDFGSQVLQWAVSTILWNPNEAPARNLP